MWVYDTYAKSGWLVFGGTSVASPVIASVFALAGGTATQTGGQSMYTKSAALFDITSGSNGSCGNYQCTGGPGWDGPTGNGSPNGTTAFQ